MLHLHLLDIQDRSMMRPLLHAALRGALEHAVTAGNNGIACLTGASSMLMAHLRQSMPLSCVCRWHHQLSARCAALLVLLLSSLLCAFACMAAFMVAETCTLMRRGGVTDSDSFSTCTVMLTPFAFVLVCYSTWMSAVHLWDTRLVWYYAMEVHGCGYCVRGDIVGSSKLHEPRAVKRYNSDGGPFVTVLNALHNESQIRLRMACFTLPKEVGPHIPITCDALDMVRETAVSVARRSLSCGVVYALNPHGCNLDPLFQFMQCRCLLVQSFIVFQHVTDPVRSAGCRYSSCMTAPSWACGARLRRRGGW